MKYFSQKRHLEKVYGLAAMGLFTAPVCQDFQHRMFCLRGCKLGASDCPGCPVYAKLQIINGRNELIVCPRESGKKDADDAE